LSGEVFQAPPDEYVQLQRHVYLTTLLITILLVSIASFFFDLQTSISLLIGGLSGVLYFRLLARSIGKLGNSSKGVGKIQLIVPVLLVLVGSKLPQIELLPSLLGFLLYKPSLMIQFLLK